MLMKSTRHLCEDLAKAYVFNEKEQQMTISKLSICLCAQIPPKSHKECWWGRYLE